MVRPPIDEKFTMFGVQRSSHANGCGARWYVTEQASYAASLLTFPQARIVAASSPLTQAQSRELFQPAARLESELEAPVDRVVASGSTRRRGHVPARRPSA